MIEILSTSGCRRALSFRSWFAWLLLVAGLFTGLVSNGSAQTPSPAIIMPTTPAANASASAATPAAPASTPANADPFRLNIGLEGTGQPGQVSVAVQIVLVMTLLSVAPSIVLLMTTFTRIVIVLGFVRTALGTPSVLLFGPTSPARWGPPPDRSQHITLWAGIEGDPHAEVTSDGLLRIAVTEVLAALAQLDLSDRCTSGNDGA